MRVAKVSLGAPALNPELCLRPFRTGSGSPSASSDREADTLADDRQTDCDSGTLKPSPAQAGEL